jgi:hypothetical protein
MIEILILNFGIVWGSFGLSMLRSTDGLTAEPSSAAQFTPTSILRNARSASPLSR